MVYSFSKIKKLFSWRNNNNLYFLQRTLAMVLKSDWMYMYKNILAGLLEALYNNC